MSEPPAGTQWDSEAEDPRLIHHALMPPRVSGPTAVCLLDTVRQDLSSSLGFGWFMSFRQLSSLHPACTTHLLSVDDDTSLECRIKTDKGLERSACFVHLSAQEFFHTTAFLSSSHSLLWRHTLLLGTGFPFHNAQRRAPAASSPPAWNLANLLFSPETHQPTMLMEQHPPLLCRCCLDECAS